MANEHTFNIARFEKAQAEIYQSVVAELRAGQKRSHWMWFVFPQMRGLGLSERAQFFGITSRGEAEAYLAHPVLGVRLRECVRLVQIIEGRTAKEIFGAVDDMKLRSCLTLFDAVSPKDVFGEVLEKYYDGERDAKTLRLLN